MFLIVALSVNFVHKSLFSLYLVLCSPPPSTGGYSHKPLNLCENSSELHNKSREFSYHKAISCFVHALHEMWFVDQDLPISLPLRSMLDSLHMYTYCFTWDDPVKSPIALRLILRGLPSPETEA